jgi:hypothetical protein
MKKITFTIIWLALTYEVEARFFSFCSEIIGFESLKRIVRHPQFQEYTQQAFGDFLLKAINKKEPI